MKRVGKREREKWAIKMTKHYNLLNPKGKTRRESEEEPASTAANQTVSIYDV